MTLYGYARVSTQDQKTDLQVDALIKYGVDPLLIFEDKISGKTNDRPALNQVLSLLKTGDTLVVYKLDRLGRSLQHLVETMDMLNTQGINFVAITEKFDTTTAMGKCMFHVSAAFAQFARDILIERVNDGLDAAKKRGTKLGRPTVLPDESKQKALELWSTTGMTIRQIAKETGLTPSAVFRTIGSTPKPQGLRQPRPKKAPKPPKPYVPKNPRKSKDPIIQTKPPGTDTTWDDFFTMI